MTIYRFKPQRHKDHKDLLFFYLLFVLFVSLWFFPSLSMAQTVTTNSAPMTDQERAELLEMIRNLQERVAKLEAAQAQKQTTPTVEAPEPAPDSFAVQEKVAEPKPAPVDVPNVPKQEEKKLFGIYTPNVGFKVADTEYGDLSVSIYTYCRYLNQQGLRPTFQDSFGNIKNVQERQDFQINKVQIKFLGWLFDPKFRYFLYAWTSNATQGQPAQVVLAGNLSYSFNKYITIASGITSLPGVRSTEGNFPFWLGVDSRLIADEFFRPSYSSGIWVKGELTKGLLYQAMIANNLSTLGVSAARLDNGFDTFSSELVWMPTTKEFGKGFGDFEDHDRLATRLAVHYTRSDEDAEEQPGSDVFENTQLRISDGNIIFQPNLFGPGITINKATYKMLSIDGGLKYHGFALEGEYYFRRLDHFNGPNTEGLPKLTDHGFQSQFSAMVIPKMLQYYAGYSKIFGQFGQPFDFRTGFNLFPFGNKVLRLNTEYLYLRNSPVGYTSVPFALGGRGSIFHTTLEMAF